MITDFGQQGCVGSRRALPILVLSSENLHSTFLPPSRRSLLQQTYADNHLRPHCLHSCVPHWFRVCPPLLLRANNLSVAQSQYRLRCALPMCFEEIYGYNGWCCQCHQRCVCSDYTRVGHLSVEDTEEEEECVICAFWEWCYVSSQLIYPLRRAICTNERYSVVGAGIARTVWLSRLHTDSRRDLTCKPVVPISFGPEVDVQKGSPTNLSSGRQSSCKATCSAPLLRL